MADEIKIKLTAEDDISSVIKKVTEHLSETGLGSAITAASTSFLALEKAMEVVAGAAEKVFNVISGGAADAAKAENTNKQLAMSMASVGQYTEKAFLAMDEWANSLQIATGQEAESMKQAVALGMQMGMTAAQAKLAATAALDLAAATGQDMNTAFRQIGMTMSGSAGKLEKFIPELRELTREELESGRAIEIISKKYDGFAGNMAGGYTGALKKYEAALGEIPEAFGRLIAQNPAVIAAIEGFANILNDAASAIDELSTYILNNSEDIKILAVSFGIASAAVLAYTAYQNAATIATVALKVATIAMNTAMALTPYGLIIAAVAALTAGFYYFYKNIDLVSGALKVGMGYALSLITSQMYLLLMGISKVVGIFNEDLGNAIEKTAEQIDAMSENLKKAGREQMALADTSVKSAEQQSTSAMMVSRATAGITEKIKETEQEVLKLESSFAKALESSRAAFTGLKDFMPRMNLNEFKNDAESWKKSINELKTQAEALKIKLQVGVQTDEVKAELEKVNEQLGYAVEAQKALKIRSAVEAREATTKEVQIGLDQEKARTISVGMEIGQMRLAQSQDIRNQLIDIETQRLLEQRGLETADLQAGLSIKQASQLSAYETEMAAFTAKLEAEKTLSLDMESQKQLALAEMKANALGSDSAGGKGAAADVELIQAQQKQVELQRLREMDLISEAEYQNALTELKIQAITLRTTEELALMQQRQQLLGTSPEAMALALEQEKIKNDNELLMLQEKYAAQMITDDEFRVMKEEAELASQERQSQIKQQMIQRDIQQNQALKNNWAVTLGQIRLEQEKHGQLMGTIKGIQQSKEYAGMQQGLSDLSSLRSSSDRKAFEAGKVAAIAQATINTFMSATAAYSSMAAIPIVGPALGIAAAAAAIMAGMNNVAQIKSQKFQGGAHGGIDEIPKSMNNSTFVLKAGERVVQPDQNKELGMAIDKINEGGGSGGGHQINITIQGDVTENVVMKMKDEIINILRDASERGTPIINERGIVRA